MSQLKPKIIVCACCGKDFDASKRNQGKGRQMYCGPECRQVMDTRRHQRRRELSPPKRIINQCVVCEQDFITDAHHPKALTCSVKCNEARMNAKRRRETLINYDAIGKKECEECGKEYWPNKHAGRPKYCSQQCASRFSSRANYARNKRNYDRRLLTPKWKKEKKFALERDDHKCRACGSTEKLHGHHVFYMTEMDRHNHSLENVITFCHPCHNKMHDFRISKINGEYVISGAIFNFINVQTLKVIYAKQNS